MSDSAENEPATPVLFPGIYSMLQLYVPLSFTRHANCELLFPLTLRSAVSTNCTDLIDQRGDHVSTRHDHVPVLRAIETASYPSCPCRCHIFDSCHFSFG